MWNKTSKRPLPSTNGRQAACCHPWWTTSFSSCKSHAAAPWPLAACSARLLCSVRAMGCYPGHCVRRWMGGGRCDDLREGSAEKPLRVRLARACRVVLGTPALTPTHVRAHILYSMCGATALSVLAVRDLKCFYHLIEVHLRTSHIPLLRPCTPPFLTLARGPAPGAAACRIRRGGKSADGRCGVRGRRFQQYRRICRVSVE